MYTIKSYTKGFEEDLAKISLAQPWTHFQRRTKENFLNLSEHEEFDPELNPLIFQGEELIGYLISYLSKENNNQFVNMWLPVVKDGFEDAQDDLLKYILEIYKRRKYHLIKTNQGSEWRKLLGFPEKYGFKRTIDLVSTVRKSVNDFNISTFPVLKNIYPYSREKHNLIIKEYLKKQNPNNSDDKILEFIEKKLGNPYFISFVCIEKSKFMGWIQMHSFNSKENPIQIRKILWLFKFKLANPNDLNQIRGFFRFSVEYARKEGYSTIDFFMRSNDENGFKQFEAINELPYPHRYEYELKL